MFLIWCHRAEVNFCNERENIFQVASAYKICRSLHRLFKISVWKFDSAPIFEIIRMRFNVQKQIVLFFKTKRISFPKRRGKTRHCVWCSSPSRSTYTFFMETHFVRNINLRSMPIFSQTLKKFLWWLSELLLQTCCWLYFIDCLETSSIPFHHRLT